jgi:hypothetical protein
VGTSAHALKMQLWTALIAMLLVKYLQLKSTFGWSLSNLVALLRQQNYFSTAICGPGSMILSSHRGYRKNCPSN